MGLQNKQGKTGKWINIENSNKFKFQDSPICKKIKRGYTNTRKNAVLMKQKVGENGKTFFIIIASWHKDLPLIALQPGDAQCRHCGRRYCGPIASFGIPFLGVKTGGGKHPHAAEFIDPVVWSEPLWGSVTPDDVCDRSAISKKLFFLSFFFGKTLMRIIVKYKFPWRLGRQETKMIENAGNFYSSLYFFFCMPYFGKTVSYTLHRVTLFQTAFHLPFNFSFFFFV